MALVGMASKPLHVRRLQKALQEWVQNPGKTLDRPLPPPSTDQQPTCQPSTSCMACPHLSIPSFPYGFYCERPCTNCDEWECGGNGNVAGRKASLGSPVKDNQHSRIWLSSCLFPFPPAPSTFLVSASETSCIFKGRKIRRFRGSRLDSLVSGSISPQGEEEGDP